MNIIKGLYIAFLTVSLLLKIATVVETTRHITKRKKKNEDANAHSRA